MGLLPASKVSLLPSKTQSSDQDRLTFSGNIEGPKTYKEYQKVVVHQLGELRGYFWAQNKKTKSPEIKKNDFSTHRSNPYLPIGIR